MRPTPYFSDSPVSLGSEGSPLGNQPADAPSPINFPAPGESMADTSTLSPEANTPSSPGCPVVTVKSEYLLGSPSPGTPRGDSLRGAGGGGGGGGGGQEGRDAACPDRASPDSVFPDASPMVSFRVVDEPQQQQQQQHHHQQPQPPQHQQQRSATPAPTRSSPYSPVQTVSSTPMGQEATSRADSPDKGDLSSAQTKEESDNSVFDGGGGGGGGGGSARLEASSQPSHRNSPSSQFNPSQSVSPGGGTAHGPQQQAPQTSPTPARPRAPSVPPHLLAHHHQFWSQNTGVQGFATQRLLNGVISSVGYGQNATAVSTSSGTSTSGNVASCVTTGATTTATSCKYHVELSDSKISTPLPLDSFL